MENEKCGCNSEKIDEKPVKKPNKNENCGCGCGSADKKIDKSD